jgi:GR25 family glycosyltransferase involved in LPS biosynthesis
LDEISRIKQSSICKLKLYIVSCSEGRVERLRKAALPLQIDFEVIQSPWYTEEEVQRRGKELFEHKTGYPTGVAATLGHLRAMKRFLETKEEFCMILEDDVRFHKDFNYQIHHIETYMKQKDCNMFSIGFVNIPVSNHIKKLHSLDIIENVPISNPWGCQCYMISRSYAEILVSLFANDNIYEVYTKTFVTDSVFFDTELGCKRSTLVKPIVVEDPSEQTLAGNNNKPDLFKILHRGDFLF